MKRHASSRSELLLIEILLSILCFALASAFCLQIFVKSHTLSQDAQSRNLAITQVNSIYTLLSDDTLPANVWTEFYPEGEFEFNTDIDNTLNQGKLGFDQYLEPCQPTDAIYTLQIDTSYAADGITTYVLIFTDTVHQKTIYSTELAIHRRLRKDVMS